MTNFSAAVRIAFFGLPLAACLLSTDGHEVVIALLSRGDAPGIRRLRRTIGAERVAVRPRLDDRWLARVRDARPDLVVSWFWTTKIPMRFVELAPLGGVGVHPSLLPRHRGPDPTTWAILSGDEVTGVTAHRIAAEYDTGAILGQHAIAIDPDWNAWQLAKALDAPSLALLRDLCARFARGEQVPEHQQDDALATEAPFLEPDDPCASIRWRATTDEVLRLVRALSPSPGAATAIGSHEVVVTRAMAVAPPSILEAPGEAVAIAGRVVVKTADAAVELVEVEHDGQVLRGDAIAALLAPSG